MGALLIVGILAPQSAVARDEQVVLAATSAWVVDYAEDSCALRRQFGGPETPVVLELRQFEPDSVDFQFLVSSEHFRLNRNGFADGVAVRYHPDSEFSDADLAFNLQQVGQRRGVTFSHSLFMREQIDFTNGPQSLDNVAREAMERSFDVAGRARRVTAIEIRNAFADDVVLQTGSLAAPLEALSNCMDELLLHWGVDAEAHRTLRQRPQPIDQPNWARRVQQAYPMSMAMRGEQAVVRIRLDVSAEGRTTGCHTQARLGMEAFDQTACDILTDRARFIPALDANGNAIASFHMLIIVYSIG
ncbi:MAG: TonB family protein [Alteraurantiacibacter sp.]